MPWVKFLISTIVFICIWNRFRIVHLIFGLQWIFFMEFGIRMKKMGKMTRILTFHRLTSSTKRISYRTFARMMLKFLLSFFLFRSRDSNDGDDARSVHSMTVASSTCDDGESSVASEGAGHKSSKKDRRPERRESTRFTSAAKLLRSLSRAPKQQDSSNSLRRSNPHYHSEGKGLRKKHGGWKSERELASHSSGSHKERSHSFCDKDSSKRRSSVVVNPEGEDFEHQDKENKEFNNSVSKAQNLPSKRPKTPPVDHQLVSSEPSPTRSLHREKDCRRSIRKLTKDSGYETCNPYGEVDYGPVDLVSAGSGAEGTARPDSDGDDVTLAPESEGASESTPSASPGLTTPLSER